MFSLVDANDVQRADVSLQWDVKIPLRDGVCLSATLYMPRGVERAPVIFTLTPYIAQMWHDFAVYFAAHGLPFLCVDVRGRGNSEGAFEPNLNEAADGHDVVQWIASQRFCDGQVAMWGGSYGGYAQWAAAREKPAGLATIVPVAAPFAGLDFPSRNNIGEPYLMQWLLLIAGRASQEKIFWRNERFWGERFRRFFESGECFRTLDRFLGMPSAIFQRCLDHPDQDEHWDRYNPSSAQYESIDVPVLTITGAYDGNQLGALTHYREHLAHAPPAAVERHYLVIGPWDHAGTRTPQLECGGLKVGPESLLDLPRLHVEWYRWTMQGGPRPEFLADRVVYYVMGADRWRHAPSLEAVTVRHQPLYLYSSVNPVDVFRSGALEATVSAEGGEGGRYIHDPLDVSLAALECTVDPENRTDDRMVFARVGKQLIYHSAPLPQNTDVCGFFRLRVWIAIDQPDTDFRASVYEVGLDGKAILLTNDILRARYRRSHRQQELISTTGPLEYDFSRFLFVARQVRAGHRLRLVIGPNHSIYAERNCHTGGVVAEELPSDARPVTVRVFQAQPYASALYVPIGRDDG
jgi:uncharacterized protein